MFTEIMRESSYAAYRSRLKDLLGIPENASETEIHDSIVHGFPAARLIELCEQGEMTPIERDQIIPLRTLKTRLSKEQPLTVDESDRFFRTAHITAMAQSVFGGRDKAKRWLTKPKERFNGQSPMSMLVTIQGTRQVEEALFQIAEGFVF